MLQPLPDRLFIMLQRLLPARLLGRCAYAISRSERHALKNALIRSFVRWYDVDVTEAEHPVPDGYPTFNAFFTRALRAGARPQDADPAAIVSPADGTVQQVGQIDGEELLQVKGLTYRLREIFGGDVGAAARYAGGAFVTIYLAPFNYHRVHAPLDGRIRAMTYVPGALWSVNAATAQRVPGLFAANERLICHCQADWGPFAVILVGAMNVASISTAWAGEVLPHRPRRMQRWDYGDAPPVLARGALLGQFNLGSTVIVVAPAGAIAWDARLARGATVRVGQRLGRRLASAGAA